MALIKEGSRIPDFKTEHLASKEFEKDKGVILFFTAPNCPHCKTLLPALENIAQKYKASGIRVLNISRSFLPELKEENRYQEWLADTEGTLFPYFGVSGFPSVILLDPRGQVLISTAGADEKLSLRLEKAISQLIN